jgi:hypothetical protein
MEMLLLLVVVVAWLVVRGMDRAEMRDRLAEQQGQIEGLRSDVLALRIAAAERERAARPVTKAVETVVAAAASPVVEVRVDASAAAPAAKAAEPVVAAAPVVPAAPVVSPAPVRVSVPGPGYGARMQAPAARPAAPPVPVSVAPRPAFVAPAAPVFAAVEPKRSLEQRLGANWLNRLGTVLLVFGVGLYLAYEFTRFGHVGKILTSFAVSLVLLVGGLWLERQERYRVFARAGIGGGWALGFLTTYAMYFFPATQVLRSQGLDLALLFGVGAGMVLHSLRYRSQVVTGLAFLLAFSTVTISQVTAFSLLASAVLAIGLEIVCVREAWFALEVTGVLAAYGNHFLWMERTMEPVGGAGHAFPLWGESTGLLILFWAIFRVGYCLRKPKDSTDESLSGLAAVLNSACLLGLMKYQSFHPELAFWALLGLGAVEMGLAFAMRGRRRAAFGVLATIGSILVVAAVPFRFGGATWPVVWVVQGEALFLLGIWLSPKERLLRWLGVVTQLLAVGQMVVMHTDAIAGLRPEGWGWIAGALFAAAAALWVNGEWLGRAEWDGEERGDWLGGAMVLCSLVAAGCLGAAVWMVDPGWTLVLAWAGVGVVLLEAGLRVRSLALRVESYVLQATALSRLGMVNLLAQGKAGWGDVRLWAGVGVAAVCVLFQERLRRTDARSDEERAVAGEAASWCGAGLAGWLLYLELPGEWLAVGLAGLALVLVEAGLRERLVGRRLQGYGELAGGLGWWGLVNVPVGVRGWGDPRLWAGVALVGACVLGAERLRRGDVAEGGGVAGGAMWCASGLTSALLYLEVPGDWLAAAWAGFGLGLAGFALARDGVRIRNKALVLGLMAAGRAVYVNLGGAWDQAATANFSGDWNRAAFFTAVGLLVLAVPVGVVLRRRRLEDGPGSYGAIEILRRPEQVYFFAALASLVLWVPVDMHRGALTMGWSGLGVVAFLGALAAGERSFRLAGLGLLLLGVGKLLVVDVWAVQTAERYLLLIGVGIALLLVSFLYSRFGERLKEYL